MIPEDSGTDTEERMLSIPDCAHRLRISETAARKLFRHEPGVLVIQPPGYKKPLISVPEAVFQRVRRRVANPERR